MSDDYFVEVDSFPISNLNWKRQWRRVSHFSTLGYLEIKFEEGNREHNDLPTSIVAASFSFIPNIDIHGTGVYASFRREMQMAHTPSISRHVCEILLIGDDTCRVLYRAPCHDDLPGIQHVLSSGEVRPWDQNSVGDNLLAVWQHSLF